MKLLTRYVIREHAGPLVFALSALTSLLMLQYVARQLANLAGKGLPWSAIGKFFVLSLPFTIAMTLPMAVLVATLYAFGRMAAEHEITAFKASGVRVRSLMAPVLVCALLLSLFMVWFNDQLLPRTNHALRILNNDIAKTKPTLALKEQVMNPITDQFFMRVARVDARTNRMYDVTIYDLRKGPERQTIYADSGVFLLDAKGEDLQLQLMDGHAQEFVRADPRRLQRSFFRTQTVQLRGIIRQFEATAEDNYRGDREQTVCQMHRTYMENAREFTRLRNAYIDQASRAASKGSKTLTVSRDRPPKEVLSTFYCETLLGGFSTMLLPKKAKAQSAQPPVQQPPV
ncbi:MAG: LptF/LptG family permease, partial [Gemmatimonas sp.]|uniref:LptF/LptG family permease n=1 Tax=Gemmatimonas sp. TaxID=1962908 RepID=UPI00391F10EB